MNILIYGAGAIGGWLGTNLAMVGNMVAFVARPYQIEGIETKGIEIVEGDKRLFRPMRAYSDLPSALCCPYDLLILGVKTYHLPVVMADIALHYPDVPMILITQNGIGIEQPLIDQFGASRLLMSAVTAPVRRAEQDVMVVEQAGRGLALSPVLAGQSIAQWVGLFEGTLVKSAELPDYRAMKWSKALFNFIGNASSAILNWHPHRIYAHDGLFRMEMGMFQELLRMMAYLKIRPVKLAGVPAPLFAWGLRWWPYSWLKYAMPYIIKAGRGDKMPSFHLDLMAGKRENEVLYHNMAVANLGRIHHLPMPINTVLGRTVWQLAQQQLPLGSFHDQPERLLGLIDEEINLLS